MFGQQQQRRISTSMSSSRGDKTMLKSGTRNASQTASSGFGVKKQQNTPAQKNEMLIENQSNEGSRVRGVATS